MKQTIPQIWTTQCNKSLLLTHISTHCGFEGGRWQWGWLLHAVIQRTTFFHRVTPPSSGFLEFSLFSQAKKKRVRIVLGQFLQARRQKGPYLSWSYSTGLNSITGRHLTQGTLGNVVQLCQRKSGSQIFLGTAGLCYRHCAGHNNMIRRSVTILAVRIL